jgi:hypothetical protein
MNILTLKLDKKEEPLIFGRSLVVKVNEKLSSEHSILIYSSVSGIILDTGVMVLPSNYNDEIVLRLKNNSDKTILLLDGTIIANYLEIIQNVKEKSNGVCKSAKPDSKKAGNK